MVSTATAAQTISVEAFNQLVLEKGLRTWDNLGYRYAGFLGTNGWELYRVYLDWDRVPITTGTTANPAAGAQLASLTVPAGKLWRLLGASYTLTTDANVADRIPSMSIRVDGTNTTVATATNLTVTASITTIRVSFGQGVSAGGVIASSGLVTATLPDIVLPAGSVVVNFLYGIQAGDDMTQEYYTYQEVDA